MYLIILISPHDYDGITMLRHVYIWANFKCILLENSTFSCIWLFEAKNRISTLITNSISIVQGNIMTMLMPIGIARSFCTNRCRLKPRARRNPAISIISLTENPNFQQVLANLHLFIFLLPSFAFVLLIKSHNN